MPTFNVALPANAGYFFRIVLQIASFDIIDVDWYYRKLFRLPPTEPVNINFNMLGFESTYYISNLGTLVLVYLLFAILILFL